MAKNTGEGSRQAAVTERSQTLNPATGQWVKRNAYTGKFIAVKKTGGTFKGVKKEK